MSDHLPKYGGKRVREKPVVDSARPKLFTIVTAVFNDAEGAEQTIQSVLDQSYDGFEYIIIDGGSTDGTLDVLRRYEHAIDYWVSEPDRGVYDAFNKACRLARGEWTIFLGAGDAFHDPDVLTRVARELLRVGEETEIVYGRVSVNDGHNVSVELLNEQWSQIQGRWSSGRPLFPHHQGVFHRKRLLAGKPFDSRYKIAADSKLLYESFRTSDPVFIDTVISVATLGGVSTSPRHSIATANEILQINHELGFGNYPHQLWFYLKSVCKSLMYRIGGDRLAKLYIDRYRQLTGRQRKWSRYTAK